MRIGLRELLCSLLIVLSRIRDEGVIGSPSISLSAYRLRVDSEFHRRSFSNEDSTEDEPAEFSVRDGCSFPSCAHAGDCWSGDRYGDFYPGAEARIYAAGRNAGFDADVDAARGNRSGEGADAGAAGLFIRMRMRTRLGRCCCIWRRRSGSINCIRSTG